MTKSDEAAIAEGCHFDGTGAERVRRFAQKCCVHSKGRWAGEPFDFTPDCWEHFIKPLYGWKRADGSRRFSHAFKFVPKKNGKSTECAVLALYHLTADNEPAPEVYGAAKNRQQAGTVFNEVKLFVDSSPVLRAPFLRVVDTKKAVHCDSTGGFYRCLSADAGTQEGLNISALIRDELHALKDRKLYSALRFGGAARRQPLTIDITTAGDDKESVCYELYAKAKRVLAGDEIDTAFLPYIREAADGDDPDDPATWAKANPSWGITIDPARFKQDWASSKASPSDWNDFLRYRLNRWVESTTGWLPIESWDACRGEPEFPDGAKVFGGLDLSSTTDLTAFVLWCPSTYSLRVWYWVPREAFRHRERRNQERIDRYERTGHIKVIEGARIDHDIIEKDIVEICSQYNVQKIGADPYNAVDLLMRLYRVHGLDVEPYRQGMLHLSPPMKHIEGLILQGMLRHGGHPVMRWNFRNVAVKTDESENKRPVKDKSADKIDGVVALLMAAGVAMKTDQTPSVYEQGQGL